MDRIVNESDAQYRSRLINMPTVNLSNEDKALLASKIYVLNEQGETSFFWLLLLASAQVSYFFKPFVNYLIV